MKHYTLIISIFVLLSACGKDGENNTSIKDAGHSDTQKEPDGVVFPDNDSGSKSDMGNDTSTSTDSSQDMVEDTSPPKVESYRSLKMPDSVPFETGPRDVLVATCNADALSNSDAIKSAISGASDNACIRIADGSYDLGLVELNAKKVTIAAVNVGQVILGGSTSIHVLGDGALLEGLSFVEGDGGADDQHGIEVEAQDVHLSRLLFKDWGKATPDDVAICIRIHYSAGGLEISDSRFTNIYGMTALQPQRTDAGWISSKGMWIHHNEWIDNPQYHSNGGETIRIGTAWAYAQGVPGPPDSGYDDDTEMVFEYNSMIRHNGEGEIISFKSSRNIFQYNYLEDCNPGALVVRMGNRNLFYGNWMVGERKCASDLRREEPRRVYLF